MHATLVQDVRDLSVGVLTEQGIDLLSHLWVCSTQLRGRQRAWQCQRSGAAARVTDAHVPLASWFNELVEPLLVQAAFSGPIYDAYCNKVFWKLFA